PAASDMLPTVPAMLQHFRYRAARFFQCISENGHSVKSPVVVDLPGKGFHGAGEPFGLEGHGAEGIAKDATEQTRMVLVRNHSSFRFGLSIFCRTLIFWSGCFYRSDFPYDMGYDDIGTPC